MIRQSGERVSLPGRLCCFILVAAAARCQAVGSDDFELVLRDLTLVQTAALQFDEEGVVLSDGTIYAWDQVLTLTSEDADQKAEFDRFVTELGLPLFRIRHRLANRDWSSLSKIVEPYYDLQKSRPTTNVNQRTKYIVNLATFYSRLHRGNRTEALLPFVQACRIGKEFALNLESEFDQVGLTKAEINDEFTTKLLPIWFDESAAKQVSGELKSNYIADATDTSAGLLIYHASLAIASNQIGRAGKLLSQMSELPDETVIEWLPILNAQLEIKQGVPGAATEALMATYKEMTGPHRAVAGYLIALQVSGNRDDYDAAVLELLDIPAVYGHRLKSLSAAALHQAALYSERAERMDEAAIFKAELLKHYRNTYHGRLTGGAIREEADW